MIPLRLLLLLVETAVWWSINLPLFLLGLVLVPFAIWFRVVQRGPITDRLIANAPRWLWLWGNDEDGLAADWYDQQHQDWSPFRVMYTWSALRNSVNNLRFVPVLSPKLNPAQIGWWHSKSGNVIVCWQGWYVGIETPWFHHGYNVQPEDGLHPGWIPATDFRWRGIGFRTGLNHTQG